MFALRYGSNYCEQSSKEPNRDHAAEKSFKLERSVSDYTEPRVDRDSQNEEGRGDIANVNEKALTETPV